MVPKIVDHDQRRRDIIQATWQVIAREGIANATTRQIAKEADCSLGILVHYFKDKAEIMASAMLAAHNEVNVREDPTSRGLSALRAFMLECLPLDARRQFLTVIEASFWGQAVGNQRLIDLNSSEIASLRGRIKLRLDQAREDGELKPQVDIASVVVEFHVLIDGLSIQAALYPKSSSKRQQTALLDAIIERIAVAKPDTAKSSVAKSGVGKPTTAKPRRSRSAVKAG